MAATPAAATAASKQHIRLPTPAAQAATRPSTTAAAAASNFNVFLISHWPRQRDAAAAGPWPLEGLPSPLVPQPCEQHTALLAYTYIYSSPAAVGEGLERSLHLVPHCP